MRRREFIAGLGGAAAWPLAARAQQRTKLTIGWLGLGLVSAAEFRRGLAEVGFSEGDITIEHRSVPRDGRPLPELAADLVRQRPAAIIAGNGNVVWALKAATRDIPIIFSVGYNPVELGLVASLNRPGGNLTGIMLLGTEMAEKRLQLLHEAVPAIETIALLVGSADVPFNQSETLYAQSAARTLGLRLLVFNVLIGTEIAPVFATLVGQQAGAVLMGGSLFEILGRSDEILSHAARYALPTMSVYSSQARAGGLLSYGTHYIGMSRQMGVYSGRILKGEKPGDLPVIEPTKFEFVINLKTAKALGLTIPTNLLVRADEVIEE